ncbi:MAG: hypothetical protein LBS65_09325 [Desulfovibrio sp.]|jgi:hypothetical protein|nr:hypothetical protein [Desulfovibrio sp.]
MKTGKETGAGYFFFVAPSVEQETEDLRSALKYPPMRRIFRRLLAVGNVLGPSKALDRESTEYNEGIRAVGLWLAARIEKAAPGELAALLRESGEDRISATMRANNKE